nr:MAG TPA: hypothetical protein [Caudoviricetes sp.]
MDSGIVFWFPDETNYPPHLNHVAGAGDNSILSELQNH